MTFLFYWTGALVWVSVALLFILAVLFVAWQVGLAIISTLMQVYWVKRANIKRNDVSFWYIVRQDCGDSTEDQLDRIRRFWRRARNRTQPPIKTGFLNIPQLDDLPLEPHNRPFPKE